MYRQASSVSHPTAQRMGERDDGSTLNQLIGTAGDIYVRGEEEEKENRCSLRET